MNLEEVKVHCISDYVSAMDLAIAMSAIGAKGYFSDDPDDVKDVLNLSDSLFINIGTVNFRTTRSMMKAGIFANLKDKPIVLYPLGINQSAHRRQIIENFISDFKIDLIIGDAWEILSARDIANLGESVEYTEKKLLEEVVEAARELAKRTGMTVVVVDDVDIAISGDNELISMEHENPVQYGYKTIYGGVIAALMGSGKSAWDSVRKASELMDLARDRAFEEVETRKVRFGDFNSVVIDELWQQSRKNRE